MSLLIKILSIWFGLHLYGHAHTQEYQDIFLQGETENVKKIQSSALFSREEYEIYENGRPKSHPRIHGYSAGILYREEQDIWFRLWPRSIDVKPSGSQIFEKARGVVTCRKKNDDGTAPVKVTCCRTQKLASSVVPHTSDPVAQPNEIQLNSIQRRVCMEVATCLEESGIEDFKKQIQNQVRQRFKKTVSTASDIGQAMVTPLPGDIQPAFDECIFALKEARDKTIKAMKNAQLLKKPEKG